MPEAVPPPVAWPLPDQWHAVEQLLQRLVDEGELNSVSCAAYDHSTGQTFYATAAAPGYRLPTHANRPEEGPCYLVASLTKPVVALAALHLVEAGCFTLNDRVSHYLPEWNRGEKRQITIRQLLCHASGLPDQLPDNLEMRARGASLAEFYDGTTQVELEFLPGTRAQYQSMGFIVLARLIEHLTGHPLREELHRRIFSPLQMTRSRLGLGDTPVLPSGTEYDPHTAGVVRVDLEGEQTPGTGDWNSRYWQALGAPWGGLLSTAGDMLRFCIAGIRAAQGDGDRVFSSAVFEESTRNQLALFEQMSPHEQRFRPWGLGWRHNWKTHRDTFGDFLDESAVGHWGATGCLMWIDGARQRTCVICSNRPSSQSRRALIRLSNTIHSYLCRQSQQ